MRPLLVCPLALLLLCCQPPESRSAKTDIAPQESDAAPAAPADEWDVRSSLVRINSTQQTWNVWQPWEKNPPQRRRALAAIVGPQLVITTAELVADATYLEFESPDGSRFAAAKVIVADYEANLALLGPVSDKEGERFFAGTVPFEIAAPPGIGSTLEVLQLEDNGLPIITSGSLQSVDVSPNLMPGHGFLTYLLKASMRSVSSSYTLPVLHGRKLAGVLLSYSAKDQLCDVVSTNILARFITEATNGKYDGFPGLGISITRTEDSQFRQWLGLREDQGGLYIRSVRKGAAADRAGVRKGDVLLAIDGQAIDRRGYYEHPQYGNLSWGHLIRGSKPNYLIKGGMVFMELSRPVLESFGDDWSSRAPLNLLDAFENPQNYEESMDRVVFLSGAIPTPATVGYERLRNLIVKKVNGVEIRNMKSLKDAFEGHDKDIHTIEFADDNLTVHLDELISSEVDAQLLQRGISRLYRTE